MFTTEALAEAVPGHEFSIVEENGRKFIACDGRRLKVLWYEQDSELMQDVRAIHSDKVETELWNVIVRCVMKELGMIGIDEI